MKKITFLLVFILGIWTSVHGNVNIMSISVIPSSPTDTQHVKAVVSSQFSSGPCILINSVSTIQNDTIRLTAVYSVGMLTVICNARDTFDLGILPCTIRGLSVTVMESGSTTGSDLASQPLHITCTPTGIKTIKGEQGFQLFPNPADRELTVKVTGKNNARVKITILNVIGETVYSPNDFFPGKNNEFTINISSLVKGIYFVKMEAGDGMMVKRFMKE